MTCPICDKDDDQVRVIHPGSGFRFLKISQPHYLATWCSCGCIFDDTTTGPDNKPRVLAVVSTALTQEEVAQHRQEWLEG